jgi:quinol monooxygenase YgiN
MKRVIVQYKVKADRAAENEAYVRKVFEELKQTTPDGIRYATFKQADGVSFVHIASIETEDGNSPLNESPAFKAFQAEIKDRCEEPPVAVDLQEIGSYRFMEG